jgi:hypothetical protein
VSCREREVAHGFSNARKGAAGAGSAYLVVTFSFQMNASGQRDYKSVSLVDAGHGAIIAIAAGLRRVNFIGVELAFNVGCRCLTELRRTAP